MMNERNDDCGPAVGYTNGKQIEDVVLRGHFIVFAIISKFQSLMLKSLSIHWSPTQVSETSSQK